MKLHGYCTDCHRVRQVRVSGHGLAMGHASGVVQGVCDDCALTPQDLLRESERVCGDDLEARAAWLRNYLSRNAYSALLLLQRGRTR